MNDSIHDCYVSVVGKVPTEEQIQSIFNQLPNDIKHLADQWGWNDTEVGDKVYVWIRDNPEKITCQF